jgi:hypothetical protein
MTPEIVGGHVSVSRHAAQVRRPVVTAASIAADKLEAGVRARRLIDLSLVLGAGEHRHRIAFLDAYVGGRVTLGARNGSIALNRGRLAARAAELRKGDENGIAARVAVPSCVEVRDQPVSLWITEYPPQLVPLPTQPSAHVLAIDSSRNSLLVMRPPPPRISGGNSQQP